MRVSQKRAGTVPQQYNFLPVQAICSQAMQSTHLRLCAVSKLHGTASLLRRSPLQAAVLATGIQTVADFAYAYNSAADLGDFKAFEIPYGLQTLSSAPLSPDCVELSTNARQLRSPWTNPLPCQEQALRRCLPRLTRGLNTHRPDWTRMRCNAWWTLSKESTRGQRQRAQRSTAQHRPPVFQARRGKECNEVGAMAASRVAAPIPADHGSKDNSDIEDRSAIGN